MPPSLHLLDLPGEVFNCISVAVAEACVASPWEVGMKHALWTSLSCKKLLLLEDSKLWEGFAKSKFPYVSFFEPVCRSVGWKDTFLKQWKANASSPRAIPCVLECGVLLGDFILISSLRRGGDVLMSSSVLLGEDFNDDQIHFQFIRPEGCLSLSGLFLDLFLVFVGFDGTTVRLSNSEVGVGIKGEESEVVEYVASEEEGRLVPSMNLFLDPRNAFVGGTLQFEMGGDAVCMRCVYTCLSEMFF